MKKKEEVNENRRLTYFQLIWKALPEIWSFQLFCAALSMGLTWLLRRLIRLIADTSGHGLTSGNFREMILNWRTPIMLVVGIVFVILLIIFEIFVQIYMCDDILKGRTFNLRTEIKKTFSSLKRFLTLKGILLLAFVVLAVPLIGVGFSISLTSTFYIPNFIMDVIINTPWMITGYIILIIILVIVAYLNAFSFHGILIDGMTPKEAQNNSRRLLKGNHKRFFAGILVILLIIFAIQIVLGQLTGDLPASVIEKSFSWIPSDNTFSLLDVEDISLLSETEMSIVLYRVIGCMVTVFNIYLTTMVTFIGPAFFFMQLSRFYIVFSGNAQADWPPRPKKVKAGWRIALISISFVAVMVVALVLALTYPLFFEREVPVSIIAHRAGGVLASENSLEGLEAAIEKGCYGSEIDIQRTKDGHYVVNHDNTFKRLTGVNKPSYDMTLQEIKDLEVKDTTGSGELTRIATLEEMLDAIKGKGKLFIELKGATADEQMADDVVRMVRERDMIDDVAIISLKYKLIDYVETNYPEFETGTLLILGFGTIARMNCDDLIMEEEMAAEDTVDLIHAYGKQAIVWTVNTRSSMLRFLDSKVDSIITDQIDLVHAVQEELDQRSDLKVIRDTMSE